MTNAIADDVRPIIVNKFSKQEASGRGLRSKLADPVVAGLPVLIAVSEKYLDAWKDFTGDRGTTLLCARHDVDGWWQESNLSRCRRTRHSATRACRNFQSFRTYFPIMTSEDLITADLPSPILRASSSTASLVIDDKTVRPEVSSTFTWAVVVPLLTATTLPGSILRALNFICSILMISGSRLHQRSGQPSRCVGFCGTAPSGNAGSVPLLNRAAAITRRSP